MRIAKALARLCGSVLLLVPMSGLHHAAFAEKLVAKYINVRQLPVDAAPDGAEVFALRGQYSLRCRGKTGTGRMPLELDNTQYYYDMTATISTDDPGYARLYLVLRPIETGCDPRCVEPAFTSMVPFLAWTRRGHVTVPVKQNGQLSSGDPPYSTTDMVYRVRQEPVAYLDVSIEFE